MSRLLVGTDGVESSEAIAAYLNGVVEEGDEVFVVNSLVGGDDTSAEDIGRGKDALETFEAALDHPVESHQFVRGNHPVEDFLLAADEWDVDEFVIGIRKRSPVGKMVFGSTAQNVLLESDLPVRCVPLVSG